MNSNNAAGENKEIPIISFCTDIKESVQAIEIDGEKAFNQYCYYIDNVADFYIKQLESSEAEFFRSNLWVPGDALWGLANFKNGESLKSKIIVIFSRIISAIAYSLTLTNIWSAEQEIPPLDMMNIRATAFYGQILLRKLSSSNYFLYNGRCLNACGRIQSEAKLNSMVIGFIFSPNNDTAKQKVDFLNIELPEIEFDGMDEQIRKMLFPNQLEKCGCSIKFHTVKTEENKLLLHFATYPTKKLRGLEDTIIITTNVEFQVDKSGKMFRIEHREEGSSYRKEYPLNAFDTIDLIDLVDLTADNKLGYLKEIYNNHNNIIFKYDNTSQNLILEFKGEEHYPRVVNESGGHIGKRIIDFSKDRYGILPVHDAFNNLTRDKAILIFTKNRDNEKAIIFTEIPSSKIDDIRDHNSYYDLADLCIKFKINYP
jgi:hypothetical protein